MDTALLQVADSDFPPLIAALRTGRLMAPYTAASIQHLLGHSVPSSAVQTLNQLQQFGFAADQLAVALELVFQERQNRPRLEDAIDLVMSGPEAVGVSNRDTRVVVRELFSNAQTSVLVAGYAVYQGKSVFQTLADQMVAIPGLAVRLFLDIQRGPGDTTEASLLVRRFAQRFQTTQWPDQRPLPTVYYDPRSLELPPHEKSALHAKCVVVDGRHVFISSANFTEAAQNRNLEVGVLLRSAYTAASLTRYFDALVSQRL